MSITMRVSRPTFDALTDANIYNYSLYADSDNVLIKEHSRGSGDLAYTDVATIAHDIGYIPFYLCYGEVSAGRYRINNAYSPLGGGWRVYTTTADMVIEQLYDDATLGYRYYLFYDLMG